MVHGEAGGQTCGVHNDVIHGGEKWPSKDQKSGSGEYGALWLVHGVAVGQTCGVLKNAIMVVESEPHNIRRVVMESGEHSGWFIEEQEDQLVEFRRML